MPAGIAEHVRTEDHQQHVTPITESFYDDSERITLLRLLLGLAGVSIDG